MCRRWWSRWRTSWGVCSYWSKYGTEAHFNITRNRCASYCGAAARRRRLTPAAAAAEAASLDFLLSYSDLRLVTQVLIVTNTHTTRHLCVHTCTYIIYGQPHFQAYYYSRPTRSLAKRTSILYSQGSVNTQRFHLFVRNKCKRIEISGKMNILRTDLYVNGADSRNSGKIHIGTT